MASGSANIILYVGLGMICIGLVITFVGLGDKGFRTLELKLIGPSLVGCGVFFALLRVLFCTVPSCCRACCKCCGKTEDKEELIYATVSVSFILFWEKSLKVRKYALLSRYLEKFRHLTLLTEMLVKTKIEFYRTILKNIFCKQTADKNVNLRKSALSCLNPDMSQIVNEML